MDFSSFKLDIDELIEEFVEGRLTTVADMRRVWLDRKFSYIFEARPSSNLALFMQSLYGHCISFLNPTNCLSRRLGGLYCLYFLYETQPFKPPFKIYVSLGDLRNLKALVFNSKENGIEVVSAVIQKMLDKTTFLFGSVNINESEKERTKELLDAQNASIRKMHEKLFSNTEIEHFLHMDMGMELGLKDLLKMSKEYAATKNLAVREAGQVVDVQTIKHIAEDRATIGNEIQKVVEEWGDQKVTFCQQTQSNQHHVVPVPENRADSRQEQLMSLPGSKQQPEDGDDGDDGELLHNGGYLALLMGNESPLAYGSVRDTPANQRAEEDEMLDDEFKELEDELFDDVP